MTNLVKSFKIREAGEPLTLECLKKKMAVDPVTGCWNWLGGARNSYGVIGYEGKTLLVPRVAWQFTHGEIPHDLLVCHRCDNPRCFNCEHLFLGTYLDNLWDSVRKGRTFFTGFTADQIREIRESPESTRGLARRFKADRKRIYDIRHHVNYRWVSETAAVSD